MGIMERHSRAKHAAEYVPGHAIDKGIQKLADSRVARYGRHGVLPHRGPRENAPLAILRVLARMARGTYPLGAHA